MRVRFGEVYDCPVCGKSKMEADSGVKCPVCEWTEDPVQAVNPDWKGDNNITLNEAKRIYLKYGNINKRV